MTCANFDLNETIFEVISPSITETFNERNESQSMSNFAGRFQLSRLFPIISFKITLPII